jgi:DNA-binding response OmpR family regulator
MFTMNQQERSILCVDDDRDTCELMEISLGMSGYQVDTVHSIQEGLSKARKTPYLLYSLDSRLPDGSGVELCRQIREFDRTTPIIFFSASALPNQVEDALHAGAQAYLVKPADPFEVAKTVDSLVAGSA